MDSQAQYIEKCKKLIEQKLGWGNSAHWRHRDFVNLSEIILDTTDISLSPITLKRIWGKVDFKGTANPTTLNTLVLYLGFNNWTDFIQKTNLNAPLEEAVAENKVRVENKKSPYFFNKRSIIWIATPLLVTVLFWLFFNKTNISLSHKPTAKYDYELFCENAIGTAPHTIRLDFDFSKVPADSIFLVSNKNNRRIHIKKTERVKNMLSKIPEVINYYVEIDGKFTDTITILSQSEGWVTSVLNFNENRGELPLYEKAIFNKGFLDGREETIKENCQFDNDFNFVILRNIFKTPIAGDSFIFETQIRNTNTLKINACKEMSFMVEGTDGYIEFWLVKPQCLFYSRAFLPGKTISGKSNDLKKMGVSTENWQKIKLIVKGKSLNFYLNNMAKPVFSAQYSFPIGGLYGIKYKFKGGGQVNYTNVKSLNGAKLYSENFD